MGSIHDFASLAEKYVQDSCNALIACEQMLTKWGKLNETLIPGRRAIRNFGALISRTAWFIKKRQLTTNQPIPLFIQLKGAVEWTIGTERAFHNLVVFFFDAFISKLYDSQKYRSEEINEESFRTAFVNSVDKLYIEMNGDIENSFMEALIPAKEKIQKKGNIGWGFGKFNLCDIAQAAKEGAEATISSISSRHRGMKVTLAAPDPGAMVVAIIFEAMSNDDVNAAFNYCTRVDEDCLKKKNAVAKLENTWARHSNQRLPL